MPKIFLIKNRLHEQQLRLLQQNAQLNKNDLGNILGDSQQPLSLIVNKKEGKHHVIFFIEEEAASVSSVRRGREGG